MTAEWFPLFFQRRRRRPAVAIIIMYARFSSDGYAFIHADRWTMASTTMMYHRNNQNKQKIIVKERNYAPRLMLYDSTLHMMIYAFLLLAKRQFVLSVESFRFSNNFSVIFVFVLSNSFSFHLSHRVGGFFYSLLSGNHRFDFIHPSLWLCHSIFSSAPFYLCESYSIDDVNDVNIFSEHQSVCTPSGENQNGMCEMRRHTSVIQKTQIFRFDQMHNL